MKEPLFTIITVTFNAEKTIRATLDSVKAQTFTDFEMIVQDGCSRDLTVETARAAAIPQMKIVVERDRGIYDAMNKAMDATTGRYLIFLNAGDAFHSPDTLARLAALIERHNEPGIIYGQTDIVDSQRRRLGPRHLTAPEHLTLDSFRDGMTVCHQAFVALRRISGPYDLKFRYSADYDWCIRCLQHSRHNIYAGDVVIDYLDEGVTTANRRKSLAERFRIMCRYYGWFSTSVRHLRFAFRFLRRRSEEKRMRRDASQR